MPKDMEKAALLDFYGGLLSDHQRDFFDLYYNEDLSLGEIAENAGITRQAVLGNIRKAEKNLEAFEKKLGLLKRHEQNLKITEKMTKPSLQWRISGRNRKTWILDSQQQLRC